MGPLSRKQQREDTKFLFDEMRKTVALKKDQQRKDELHKQKLANVQQKHDTSLDVPPSNRKMPKPTNPEAGPSDTVPALLTPGEAVIPAKAAQNPKNKPVIKAMVREGRSDKNLSVPKPEGFMCGTDKVKGYADGITNVQLDPNEVFDYQKLTEEDYNPSGYQVFNADSSLEVPQVQDQKDIGYGWTYFKDYAVDPNGNKVPYSTTEQDKAVVQDASTSKNSVAAVPAISEADKLKQQTIEDRRAVGNFGNRVAATVAAPVDVLLGGYNMAATGVDKAVNAFNDSRVGRFFGADAYKMDVPKVGKGEFVMPLSEKVKRIEEASKSPVPTERKEVAGDVVRDEKGEVISSSGATVATRNQNPGNLRYGGLYNPETKLYEDTGKRLDGQIGVDAKTGFAIFPNHEAGRAALEKQITLDTQTRGMTLEQFIQKYAPASDNNKPKAYAETIGKELGIKITDKIPADKIGLVADVITKVESGPKGYIPNATVANSPRNEAKAPVTAEVPKQDAQTEYLTAIENKPFNQRTQQEQMLYEQENKIAEVPKPEPEGWVQYITNGLVSGLENAWNTIKDPNKFASATGSFLKDTLGLEAADAARYATLYATQRALGVSERGAALYAGKYTLGRIDKRADTKAATEQKYIEKGYTKNAQGQWVAPIITAGEVREVTFDSGPLKNKQINLIKKQNSVTKDVVWVDQTTGKTEAQLVAEAGNRPLVPWSKQYTQEGIADSYRTWADGTGKTSEDIINDAFPKDRDNKANPLRKNLLTGREIAGQSISAFKAFGYNPNDVNNQVEMDKIVAQATRDMIKEKIANPGAEINSIEPYITKQLLVAKTGIDNSLFITSNGKEVTATNKIAQQKDSLENKLFKENPKASPAEINDKVLDEYRKLQEAYKQEVIKKKWESRATNKESGFYLFVNDYLKQK